MVVIQVPCRIQSCVLPLYSRACYPLLHAGEDTAQPYVYICLGPPCTKSVPTHFTMSYRYCTSWKQMSMHVRWWNVWLAIVQARCACKEISFTLRKSLFLQECSIDYHVYKKKLVSHEINAKTHAYLPSEESSKDAEVGDCCVEFSCASTCTAGKGKHGWIQENLIYTM